MDQPDPISPAAPLRRKGGRPTRRSAEEIGRRILAASRKLFLAHGFAGTSMDAVAAEARVSKATLYARHRDKEALFQTLAIDVLETLMKRSEAPEIMAPDLPLRLRLEALAEQIIQTQTMPEVQALIRALLLESERFPSLGQLLREEGARRGAERIRALIAAAPEAAGRSDEDLLRAAEIFIQLFRPPPPTPAMEERDHLAAQAQLRAEKSHRVAFFLRGLGMEP
ncbi:TetR/AcrR family transcriptional regulator [Neomegalonema sp.]|uniref:TetR/AcrR family transcriptional regulator n=1 Tax=Neomegalonema sp. TaxID=2039713 RepID=UPI0026366D61|nr:TetR/AcrR family transcriptional regulator [Neomegalonema sp.]MDD2868519.1 TetR/AcrR family transcriptional regulator [Neomegalonema sp.]